MLRPWIITLQLLVVTGYAAPDLSTFPKVYFEAGFTTHLEWSQETVDGKPVYAVVVTTTGPLFSVPPKIKYTCADAEVLLKYIKDWSGPNPFRKGMSLKDAQTGKPYQPDVTIIRTFVQNAEMAIVKSPPVTFCGLLMKMFWRSKPR